MTAVLPDPFTAAMGLLGQRLTAQEYESLPENARLELVDGVLHVMTPPTGLHQEVVDQLKHVLTRVRPRQYKVVREQEVRLGDDHRRNPDVLVVQAEAFDLHRFSYRPADVLLAAEVVSPGTQIADRMHKPLEYQKVGIPHYWRVETRPRIAVHTYLLGVEGRYMETGVFPVDSTMDAPGLPWAKFAVADLRPQD